uniref:ZCF37 n=1 Tax=Triticum aestivum TaxID=4565 RepID=A0A3B6DA36_WHEAT
MVLCGTASFKDVDKEEPMSGGGKQAQRKEKKKPGAGKKENPYASRGLDKFSMVLAELESRREKVLRRVDGGDHVMVRFVQSETKGWVPIVVKLPAEEPAAKAEPKKKCKQPPSPRTESTSPRGAAAPTKKKASPAGRWSWADKAIRPSQYWPFVAVLLLLSLVVFGRMFAICCTSIWWYLVPILNGEDGGPRSARPAGISARRRAKKIGEKITWASLPPRSHGKKSSSSGDHDVISPRSHAHGKKG